MRLIAVLILIFASCLRERKAQVINNGLITENVYEEQKNETALAEIDCSPVGGIRVDLISVVPSSPCGTCFAVYKKNKPNFELFFLPSQGILSYNVARGYNITVSCTDGTTSTSTVIRIRVTTNEPPYFDSSSDKPSGFKNAQTLKNGDTIYTVTDARDPDGDTIFYNMTVQPASSAYKYEIGLTDGIVRATADLASECFPALVLFIYIHDARHAVVGPKVVTINFNPYNTVPYISNLNKEIFVFENLALGEPVGPATITARDNTGSISYIFKTFPKGLEYLFEIDSTGGQAKLLLRNRLNYENFVLRTINVTITPTNDFCTPDDFYLYINVVDANDPPFLTPRDVVTFEDEGVVSYNPGFEVNDDDEEDQYSFSIIDGNVGSLFYIHPKTGVITAPVYDIDKPLPTNPTQVKLTIRVQDTKGPDSDNTTVTINFRDINDNPPVMADARYAYRVQDCTPPGVYIGNKIIATDTKDSSYDNNNVVECIPNSNAYLSVLTTCRVLLIASIPANNVSTLYVRARDLGTVPGQKTSSVVPFVVVSEACVTSSTVTPPTPATATAPTTVTTTTTTTTTTLGGIDQLIPVGSENGNDGTRNIWWIVIACIAGCILLACAGFFISRYIMPRCQGSRSKQFKSGQGQNNRTTPVNNQQNQRSNNQKNAQTPVTPTEVKPFEPKQGPDEYRLGNADNRGHYHNKNNVWSGIGRQPGKGFDL